MKIRNDSSDVSFYYHEDATADMARMDSSAVHGNLADAMKNATVLFSPPQIIQTVVKSNLPSDNDSRGSGQ